MNSLFFSQPGPHNLALILVVINRSRDTFSNPTINATIQFSGFSALSYKVIAKLASANLEDNNELTDLVKATNPDLNWRKLPDNYKFDFEPHSLTVLEFSSDQPPPL